MARIIDLGLKKHDDPIFTEGIRIISIRKPQPTANQNPSPKPADSQTVVDSDSATAQKRKDESP